MLQTPGSAWSQLIKAGNDKEKIKWLKQFANVQDDGTIQLEVQADDVKPKSLEFDTGFVKREATNEASVDASENQHIPPLQIVVLIVGTRGDVQPFVAIGKRLQEYGHRVRLATRSNFKEFVLSSGLEFFPLGGDPKVLAGCQGHGIGASGCAYVWIDFGRKAYSDCIIERMKMIGQPPSYN
ncbi:hypothetical protein AgCh_031824 [Apium graveolens]